MGPRNPVLYWLHVAQLAERSGFFKDIYELDRSQATWNGRVDSEAILLRDITCREFDSFLTFMIRG